VGKFVQISYGSGGKRTLVVLDVGGDVWQYDWEDREWKMLGTKRTMTNAQLSQRPSVRVV
jgi:hypothetical protein